jgi:hypothetical protein
MGLKGIEILDFKQ